MILYVMNIFNSIKFDTGRDTSNLIIINSSHSPSTCDVHLWILEALSYAIFDEDYLDVPPTAANLLLVHGIGVSYDQLAISDLLIAALGRSERLADILALGDVIISIILWLDHMVKLEPIDT